MTDAYSFLKQNDDFAKTLKAGDLAVVDQHAEYHAGGLYVLFRKISDGLFVKAHDSWGDPDEQGRNIVVHTYSTDGERDDVAYYATGHEAIEAFLSQED